MQKLRHGLMALVLVGACTDESASASSGASGSEESGGGEESGGEGFDPDPSWTLEPPGCGEARGLVFDGADSLVVGELDGAPVLLRVDEQGALVTTQVFEPAELRLEALRRDGDRLWLVGTRYDDDEGSRGVVIVTDLLGQELTRHELEASSSGLYGVGGIEGGGALVVGYAQSDMLVQPFGEDGPTGEPWSAPESFGPSDSVGFAARIHPEGVVACGRTSTGEGGRAWLGRYAPDGSLAWLDTGPDPGVGAYSNCRDVAITPGGEIAVAEYGYPGARVVTYDADGELLWELAEPNTGTLAIDFGLDGALYVGGWSADPTDDPFRSHSTGEQAGWILEFIDGQVAREFSAPTLLSIRDLRVNEDRLTAVGSHAADPDCSTLWVASYSLD